MTWQSNDHISGKFLLFSKEIQPVSASYLLRNESGIARSVSIYATGIFNECVNSLVIYVLWFGKIR